MFTQLEIIERCLLMFSKPRRWTQKTLALHCFLSIVSKLTLIFIPFPLTISFTRDQEGR